jgi:predicted RNA binding protein YcfA (HicA-like mRNA interferase family)
LQWVWGLALTGVSLWVFPGCFQKKSKMLALRFQKCYHNKGHQPKSPEMSKQEKLIEKICDKGQVSIEEIRALMSKLGFSTRQRGSHVTFVKENQVITIPAKAQVKKVYLVELCKILKEVR